MKKFWLKLFLFVLLLSVFFGGLIGIRYISNRGMSWKNPSQKHVIFAGASQMERGIDDNLTKEGYNITNNSERYMFTYQKLKFLLRDNPQIDIIFLQFAPTDIWEHADDKILSANEQSLFFPMCATLFEVEDFLVFRHQIKQVSSILIRSLMDYKYYFPSTYRKLLGGYIGESVNQNTIDFTTVVPSLNEGENGNEINYRYLHKIIDLCDKHKVKLYLIYCPMYHNDYYYDQQYFYDAYQREFSSVEFLDYSAWECEPDERYDAHHLNHKGAQRFTKELMKRFNFK